MILHNLYGQKEEPKFEKRIIEQRPAEAEPVLGDKPEETEPLVPARPAMAEPEPALTSSIEIIPESMPRSVEFELDNPNIFIQPETLVSEPVFINEFKSLAAEEPATVLTTQPDVRPMADPAQDDHYRRANERVNKLRALSEKLKNHTPIDTTNIYELENVPAYKRRNVELLDVTPSSESQSPKYSLGEASDKSVEIRSENSFLHKKVD